MEKLVSISSYEDVKKKIWFRVELLLSEDNVSFDSTALYSSDSSAEIAILRVCESIISLDKERFDSLCGADPSPIDRDTAIIRIKRFMQYHTVRDLEEKPIDDLLTYIENIFSLPSGTPKRPAHG